MFIRILASLALLALVAGCVQPPPVITDGSRVHGAPTGSFHMESAAFAEGATIPRKYTCDGESVSPPLLISGAPANASTVALLMLDNDVPVPQAPQREVVHWIWWNALVAPNGTVVVPEAGIAKGTVQGQGKGGAKYAGPCPPQFSSAHRYVLTAHAVDGALKLKEGASKDELVAALADHSLATAKLTGLYSRAILPSIT
jgi:Raf kinase inhibitor-like YbhB/YbcL family protein